MKTPGHDTYADHPGRAPDPHTEALAGALRFILAFYEPGQRYLDTEAWKHAEAGGRRALEAYDAR